MPQYNFIKQEVRPSTISDLKVDASFRKIAKNAICFYIWKIDDERLEAEPKTKYGTFYDDAAYIIYAASPVGTFVHQDTITREAKPSINLERFIHFWLGEHVSEQKRSNVAHKIQELDSYFNNVATEYRETQNNESPRFLSYFKKGITIRSGALSSSKIPQRLFQLCGRKWLRCIEMDSISWTHFCSDYIMLLKLDTMLFLWMGRSSSITERRNAVELVSKIRNPKSEIIVIDDGYEQSMPEEYKVNWNNYLPLAEREVCQAAPLPEKLYTNKLKIYKCGYRGQRLHLDQLDVLLPTKEDLNDSTTAYVVDGFAQGIWLWLGNRASHQDNISAMGNGRAFVKKKKYPSSTPVIRIVEGHEPLEFTRLFPTWHNDWNDSNMTFKPVSTLLGKFDSLMLCQRPKMAADTQLVDDGSGDRIIYRITQDAVIPVPTTKVVVFTTNNCYVLQYTVVTSTVNSSDAENIGIKTIIYQWNGSDASADAITKSEQFAKEKFESLDHKSMFVQMCEFDETPHFLQIFEGRLIVLQSERNVNAFNDISMNNNNSFRQKNKNKERQMTMSEIKPCDEIIILKVNGDASYNSKAVEIFPLSTFSSKDCYIIKANHIWVWCGQSSTGDAREVSKNIGTMLGECSLIMEGKEPKEYWQSISNHSHTPLITNGCSKESSPSPINCTYSAPVLKTRPLAQLFLAWTMRGKIFTQEILGYEQSDLSPECIFLLDAGLIAYIWLGKLACKFEKEKYMKIAQHYLETVSIARRPTTAVAIVRQQEEPNVFKGFFESWSNAFWNDYETYEHKRAKYSVIKSAPNMNGKLCNGENGNGTLTPVLLNNQKEFDNHQKFPLSVLQQETERLPLEVNPVKREVHLTHDDFVSVFQMNYWEFDELPFWKKQQLKKKHKIF